MPRILPLPVFLFCLLFICAISVYSSTSWKPYSQRDALMPLMNQNSEVLTAQGTGEDHVNGSWRKEWKLEGKDHYFFHAEYLSHTIQNEERSVLVEIDWKDEQNNRVATPDYPPTIELKQDDWKIIEGIIPVPEGAAHATVDLIFRWSANGEVQWRNIRFEPCSPPKPREVTVATVNFRPPNPSTPEKNLDLFAEYIQQAGKQDVDIVCLGEGITVVSTGKEYTEVAEPIPGPTTNYLGGLAKEHGMYIVAGIYEQTGETVYNTSVLMGRDGGLVGKYRKVCLPREEINGGITPGSEYPVFDLDFGRVGMMICWDVHFPEVARGLAKNGAEVILMPIWGGNELLFPARAIENQVYLVTSGYDAKTGIWDREGNATITSENGTLAVSKVNLEERTMFYWLGDFKSRIFREYPGE